MHLNLNIRGLPLSATLRINELSNKMSRAGRQVYKMGLGQSPFPVPDSLQEELRANAHQKDYLPVMGLDELRSAVSSYILRTEGVHYGPENVMIGPGSKELMFIVQLAYYGDLVIPTPSWVSYAPQASIIGRHIRWLDTDISTHWKLMPLALESLCRSDPERPRLIILNYPANPHGCTYSVGELKSLAELARQYKLVLLSDEIYSGLHHEGRHVSISRFYPEGTILSNGISKWAGAGGWRMGAFAFPKQLSWLRDAMATVASETFTSTAAPIQYAAIKAFKGGSDMDHYLNHVRRILKALGGLLTVKLRENDVVLADPQGAFYLFPDFESHRNRLHARGITTSGDMCSRLLNDTGVAILPGTDFGRSATELTARLAYVDFDGEKALKASEQVPADQPLDEAFLRTHCSSCFEAVEKIRDWLAA